MSLSQTQIIRSLGDALAWLENELQWGVERGELRHLTGRIGELYAAMITRGQMALEVNQKGYDVVSAEGEQISVKTVTTSQYVELNKKTFDQVHRVIVIRINYEDDISIEEILDVNSSDFLAICKEDSEVYRYILPKNGKGVPLEEQNIDKNVSYGPYEIVRYESGSVHVKKDGVSVEIVKPELREIAKKIGVSTINDNGNPIGTRQLGSKIIATIEGLKAK